jgi:hypothetical protein
VSDLHQLPLLGHELPAFGLPPKRKARVFKDGKHWTWEHFCFYHQGIGGYRHDSHAGAIEGALTHVRRCL